MQVAGVYVISYSVAGDSNQAPYVMLVINNSILVNAIHLTIAEEMALKLLPERFLLMQNRAITWLLIPIVVGVVCTVIYIVRLV